MKPPLRPGALKDGVGDFGIIVAYHAATDFYEIKMMGVYEQILYFTDEHFDVIL